MKRYGAVSAIGRNWVEAFDDHLMLTATGLTTLALLTAFGAFFGILGLFLGLPILVVTQIWLKEVLVKDVLDQKC